MERFDLDTFFRINLKKCIQQRHNSGQSTAEERKRTKQPSEVMQSCACSTHAHGKQEKIALEVVGHKCVDRVRIKRTHLPEQVILQAHAYA